MISKEEFFSRQKTILNKRKNQINSLFEKINKHISISGDKVLSLGCGTAYEIIILKENFNKVCAVDINNSIIDFCKEEYFCKEYSGVDFVCENNLIFLENQKGSSIDLILCLDMDSNIFPKQILSIAKNKLKQNSSIVFTERANNINIYGRLLLFPFIENLKKEFGKDFIFYEEYSENDYIDSETRDDVVLIAKKK
ncbi:MAG: class I SAM-dependent methyltransferase [Patescibacteria group bacterium]|nr:class I SAM-dependent methyltransferase [Patescibacteria group bacterium]